MAKKATAKKVTLEDIVSNGSVKFGFREVFTDEETGKQHFSIPRSDPMEYEDDFGYYFDSAEEAGKFLKEQIEEELIDEEEVQSWFLVRIEFTVVPGIPAKFNK